MLSHKTLSLVLSAALAVSAHPKCGGCAVDNCFSKAPVEQSSLTSFCYNYLSTSAPATETVTVTNTVSSTATGTLTETVDVTPTPDPATVTESSVTIIPTDTTVGTVCGVTSTVTTSLVDLPTFVNYRTVSSKQSLKPRGVATTSASTASFPVPTELAHGCKPDSLPAKLSSACSCVLGSPTTATVTVTATATDLGTETATATETSIFPTAPPATATEVITSFSVTATVETCSSTSTTTVTTTIGTGFTCGIASPSVVTSGSITCTSPAPAGQTNARLRIEGADNEGTIFEDCIASGAQDVTTPSGGTHKCDATNNGANPSPGGNMISNIAQASKKNGFTFDGTFNSQYDDFFITRIGSSDSNDGSNRYWGILQDYQYSTYGGCETAVRANVEGLWAYDAFNANAFLKLEPEYQVVSAGMTATVTVNVRDGQAGNIVQGAYINGATTNGNGDATFAVPTVPGCYQYKATKGVTIRSNAFYLTVLPPLIL